MARAYSMDLRERVVAAVERDGLAHKFADSAELQKKRVLPAEQLRPKSPGGASWKKYQGRLDQLPDQLIGFTPSTARLSAGPGGA